MAFIGQLLTTKFDGLTCALWHLIHYAFNPTSTFVNAIGVREREMLPTSSQKGMEE